MLNLLKNHPFAVEAFFEKSIVLTFAVPKEQAIDLLPECLSPDIFDDKWAFIAVAMVQTKHLRPKGFPKWMGYNFFLVGYRVFVRYINNVGKRLRGLYILKSETDNIKMEFLGNIFTHYNYTSTDIIQKTEINKTSITSHQSDFHIEFHKSVHLEVPLPANSPFANWKEARRFAGPLPFTFTYNKPTNKVLIIEGVRQHWQPTPLQVSNYHISFLNRLNINKSILANSFIVENTPYYWKKGKTELWKS
ncbi:DUF2071 domain-containing protein [Niabella ginsengisoli]|uniref:DUF2071 domain-containing protein n=1 Tax=Niabella ginsengisoli TaxID=522298 RepID=A0ABS9SJA4_9BACT|nr:DUF2071 domain-containing protein [Niabella ginsengisoli]MCH5598439.1 DUF2071 domain-containing protein [Niabella ginsengisoli]